MKKEERRKKKEERSIIDVDINFKGCCKI